MKPAIHPPYYENAKVTCTACKTVFHIPSTVKEQQIEICSHCHPVYTGKFRGIMTSGRVERFRQKIAAAKSAPPKVVKKRKLTPEEKLEKKLEVKRIATSIKATAAREKAEKTAKKTVKKEPKKTLRPFGRTQGKLRSGQAPRGKKK